MANAVIIHKTPQQHNIVYLQLPDALVAFLELLKLKKMENYNLNGLNKNPNSNNWSSSAE